MTSSIFTVAFFVWALALCACFAVLELLWLRGLGGAFASRGAFLFLTAVNVTLLLAYFFSNAVLGGYAFLFVFPIPLLPLAAFSAKILAYSQLSGRFLPGPQRHPWMLAGVGLILLPLLAWLAYDAFRRINPTRENLAAAIREKATGRLGLMLWLAFRSEPEMTNLVNEAISAGRPDAVRLLLENGADPRRGYRLGEADPPTRSLLLRWMLNRGVPVAEIAADGSSTPSLAELAAGGRVEDLQLFLERGFRPAKHPRVVAAAIEASASDADLTDKLRLLQAKGADLQAPGLLGFHPLFLVLALGDERPAALAFLLEQGADVSVRTPQPLYPPGRAELPAGLTPLMLAASQGHARSVELLRKKNADPAARDSQGKTARDYAAEAGHREIQRALENP